MTSIYEKAISLACSVVAQDIASHATSGAERYKDELEMHERRAAAIIQFRVELDSALRHEQGFQVKVR